MSPDSSAAIEQVCVCNNNNQTACGMCQITLLFIMYFSHPALPRLLNRLSSCQDSCPGPQSPGQWGTCDSWDCKTAFLSSEAGELIQDFTIEFWREIVDEGGLRFHVSYAGGLAGCGDLADQLPLLLPDGCVDHRICDAG